MVERICPACQHGNPLENRYCGACGASLERDALAPRGVNAITIAGQQLPLAQMKQVGRALAVSLAAVAAEAGLAWLRNRAQSSGLPVVPQARPAQQTIVPSSADPVQNVVTIVSQRVVEIWDQGGLTRQVVEKHIWRKEG